MYGSVSFENPYRNMATDNNKENNPESSWPRNDRPLDKGVIGLKHDGSAIKNEDIESVKKDSVSTSKLQGILSSGATTIFLVVFIALPVAMLTFGILHQHECPIQPRIPLFLIVGGASLLARVIIQMVYVLMDARSSTWREGWFGKTFQVLSFVITAVNLVWFCTGCVFVYRIDPPEFHDVESPLYCHRTVYYLAFWFLNACFIAFGVGLSVIFFIAACVNRKNT